MSGNSGGICSAQALSANGHVWKGEEEEKEEEEAIERASHSWCSSSTTQGKKLALIDPQPHRIDGFDD